VPRRREAANVLEIRLLGELAVLSNGRVLPLPASRKARALLAYLAATGLPERRERLCDLLWDGPSDPRAELRWCLSRLKPVLEADGEKRLLADREHVAFEPKGAVVDLRALEATIGTPEADSSLESLVGAAALFRGDFLAGLDLPDCRSFHSWVISHRETWRARHLEMLAALVRQLSDRPEDALPYARAFVAIDSESETGHLLVMEVLGALGRKREALEQYKTYRTMLESDFGGRPSARMEQARIALGSKRPEESISDVGRGTGETLAPPQVSSPRWPPLVGRQAELAAIAEAVDRALSGAGPHALVLTGEPGIGKSRLLEELALRVKAQGGTGLRGRGFEAEMTRPYGVWVDALRGHAPLPSTLGRFPDLAMLVPELGPVAGAVTLSPASHPATGDRGRLFDAVLGFLSHLTEEAPLAILLDDVHWLDEGSAALLHYLARRLRGKRVLLACATRPGELTANASASRLLRALGAEHGARTLAIGPLDAGATADLVRAVDPDLDPVQVFEESHGNSLFALEVARALAERGTRLSDSLEGIIADRLAALDDTAKGLVAWAACLGGRIRLDVLVSASGASGADVLRSIEDLERRAMLRVTGESYGFAHDLIQHVAYQQIAEPRRRFMHAEIAQALSKRDDPDVSLAVEIAHHAHLGAVHRLAARTAAAAGEQCLAVFANSEALAVAQRGLTHVTHLDREERLGARISLLAVAALATLADWRNRNPEIEKEVEQAVEEAHQAGVYEAAARGRFVLSMLHERDDARAHYDSILAAEDARAGASTNAARQLANAGQCLAHIQRDMVSARTFLHEAERLADDMGVEVAPGELGLGMLALWDGELDRAREHLVRALRLLRQERDRYAECTCLVYLARLELEQNRFQQALTHCKELAPVASGMGEGSEAPVAAALEALAQFALGMPETDSRLTKALDTLAAIDAQGALAYTLNAAALLDVRAGRWEAARQRAERALEAAERIGRSTEVALARVLLAEVALASGDRGAARAQLEPVMPRALDLNALDARTRRAVRSLAGRLELPIPSV
jgi:predicted ATPase/DNA-binding SARP family transcriptional activator